MKNGLAILASTLLLTNLSYADIVSINVPTPNPTIAPFKKSGFYAGAGLGSSYLNYHAIVNEPNPTINTSIYGSGVLGNFQGGYQYTRDKYSISVDGFVNVTSQRTSPNTLYGPNGDSRNMQFVNDWNLGVSILPGYMLNDYLIAYMRLGYINSHYAVNVQGADSYNFGQNVPGGQIGLGGEVWFPMLKNVSVRGEFDSIISSSWNNIGSFRSSHGTLDNSSIHISNSLFQINFVYHFV